MTKHNAANERIKRDYFQYLVEAKGRDEATIDGVAKSLARFEEQTRARDFKRFHREQAVAFKAKLALALNARTGERISKATMHATLRDLRAFFFWLAHLSADGGFIAIGLARHGWATSAPIRDIFKRAFAAAGLPYFNPHSFRDMLVHHAMSLNLSPKQMKAWSQNLGHSDVLTTFTSYGNVPVHQQGALIRAVVANDRNDGASSEQIATLELLLAGLKRGSGRS